MATGYEKAFSLVELTAAINAVAYKPYRLGQLGLFEEQGVAQTSVKIEQLNGTLSLANTAPRGGPGQAVVADKRVERTFSIPHIPLLSGIDADEVQGVRMFGSENTAESIIAVRDRLLAKMRASLEMTIEAHRVGALKGLILDRDGSTLLDLFTAFGVQQQTLGMALTTNSTKVRSKVLEIVPKVENALGGTPYSGLWAPCGDNFYRTLVNNDNVEKYWLNTPASIALASQGFDAINIGGVVFERYRGISSCTIGDDEAYVVPMGVPGLFITRYGPANYMDTVNTVGLPMYAKAMTRDLDKGFDIEAQTNPLNLCTRPNAVVKLTTV